MNNRHRYGMRALGITLLMLPAAAVAQESGFRFLATGDLPYSSQQEAAFRRLLKQSADEDFAFLMHVGDFKAQSAPCSDEEFDKVRKLFRAYPKPVVYTPGDNEWTDCHGVGADPIERLSRIRALFFKDPKTLRLDQLRAVHQSRQRKFAIYQENYRFTKAGVMFIVAHVVGSGNNHRPDHAPSLAEFNARSAANRAFLEESFSLALQTKASAVAVVIHANPDFENGSQAGFKTFLATMRGFLTKYRNPVVCIHGDTHYYRIDKPLKDKSGSVFLHFTRMEVFGSPNVAGVIVTVDPKDPEVFGYQPYYLKND